MRGRFPEWYLRDNVEKSLKRLGVERIDLFQLHSFMPSGLVELDWLETLMKMRREGKIDRIGVSLRDNRPDEGIDLADAGLVDSQQVIFNMFEQRPRLRLFPAGAKTNTAFIARVPLDSGSLTGTWTRQSYATWEPGSQPHSMFRGDRFADTMDRVERLSALCKPFYNNLVEAAMRFVLSEPQVSTLIPGMKNRREVDLNIAYCDDKLFPQELKDQARRSHLGAELLPMTEHQFERMLPWQLRAELAQSALSPIFHSAPMNGMANICLSGSIASRPTGCVFVRRNKMAALFCLPCITAPEVVMGITPWSMMMPRCASKLSSSCRFTLEKLKELWRQTGRVVFWPFSAGTAGHD